VNGWQVLASLLVSVPLALVAYVLAPARQRLLAMAIAILAGVPFHVNLGDDLEDWLQPAPTRAEAEARRYGRLAGRYEPLQAALAGRSQAEADAMVAGFREAGLATLQGFRLEQRARVLKALVDQPDDALAAGLFTGEVDRKRLLDGLNKLPPEYIKWWYQCEYAALEAAFRAEPIDPVPTARENAKALRTLVSATQLDGTRLLGILQDPHPTQADAAWAARKIYDTLATLPYEQKQQVERMLVTPRSGRG
jgi:hypothetical protein